MSLTRASSKAAEKSGSTPRSAALTSPRSNLRALAKQYYGYGYWKVQNAEALPETLRWRPGSAACVSLGHSGYITGRVFLETIPGSLRIGVGIVSSNPSQRWPTHIAIKKRIY
jgi:hypothetical protein